MNTPGRPLAFADWLDSFDVGRADADVRENHQKAAHKALLNPAFALVLARQEALGIKQMIEAETDDEALEARRDIKAMQRVKRGLLALAGDYALTLDKSENKT